VLEQSDVAHYLLSLGLVKPRSVTDEDLRVLDASRRNRVFLVTTRAGPTFVVKQALSAGDASLAHEAAILRLLARAPELAEHVPAVVREEPDGACLVLRTAGGARDWGAQAGRFPRLPARILGRTLARLHLLAVDAPPAPEPIWGLLLPEPPRSLVLDLSAGAQELVARIQASRELCGRLDRLREAGSGAAFVHGDLRWDNCLTVAAPGATRRTRVLLVDWELAGRADPAFDVATVLAEYLRVWIGSVPIVDPADPNRLVARSRHPPWRMLPAIDAFWSAYARAVPGRPALDRVVELAAVRLLQTAVERAQNQSTPSANVMALVQVADHMLRDPRAAAVILLGLRA
jgi:Ser/Thr protein kinase RdoA (MazF antagonist)